jgi:hypothetical protein
MAKSDEAKAEAETIILMNELDSHATLWTATASVRREWESYGFPVAGDKSGWTCTVPKDRIAYKPLKHI